MTDIIERLRTDKIMAQAANELELLYSDQAQRIDRARKYMNTIGELRERNAELLAALKESVRHCEICGPRARAAIAKAENHDAATEVERLRLLVAEDTGTWQDLWKSERAANDRLRAENEQLLAAVKFVSTDPCFSLLGSVTCDEVRATIAKAEIQT